MDFVSIVCQMENLHLQGRRWVEGGILCHEVGQWTLVEYILVELVEIHPTAILNIHPSLSQLLTSKRRTLNFRG